MAGLEGREEALRTLKAMRYSLDRYSINLANTRLPVPERVQWATGSLREAWILCQTLTSHLQAHLTDEERQEVASARATIFRARLTLAKLVAPFPPGDSPPTSSTAR